VTVSGTPLKQFQCGDSLVYKVLNRFDSQARYDRHCLYEGVQLIETGLFPAEFGEMLPPDVSSVLLLKPRIDEETATAPQHSGTLLQEAQQVEMMYGVETEYTI